MLGVFLERAKHRLASDGGDTQLPKADKVVLGAVLGSCRCFRHQAALALPEIQRTPPHGQIENHVLEYGFLVRDDVTSFWSGQHKQRIVVCGTHLPAIAPCVLCSHLVQFTACDSRLPGVPLPSSTSDRGRKAGTEVDH